ncbi:hypothetical protein JCM10908_005757 [Rhodotorula pacifica]|uniref:uncharacterized protein n=1 Tax=Rhodotorula pacifica TaxID=1495444 RepID=UPI003174A358
MVNPCALNPVYLFCKCACGWVCTIKGWVVLESLLLAAEYFAVAYAIRRGIFPILKGLFENVASYQVLHGPVHDWIDQLEYIFYACLVYVGIGVSGALGAILEIEILLWIYAIYLIVTGVLNAKTLWALLQNVLAAEEKFGKACNFVFAGKCKGYIEDLKTYTYAGAGIVLACQSLTLICVGVQIYRIHRKTGSWLFTFCGKGVGRKKHHHQSDEENALDKEISQSLPKQSARVREAVRLREAVPVATFDLPPAESLEGARGTASTS